MPKTPDHAIDYDDHTIDDDDIEVIVHDQSRVRFSQMHSANFEGELDVAPAGVHPPPQRVAGAPITLLYNCATQPAKCEAIGFLDIGVESSVHHGQRVTTLHSRTPNLVEYVVSHNLTGCPPTAWEDIEYNWQNRETCPFELNHLIGRVDLTLKFIDMGIRRIQWSQPEAGLHPAWQGNLADLLIDFATPQGGE